MAADRIRGTVVACPTCGAALAIPAAQPVDPLGPVRTLPSARFHQRPADDRLRLNLLIIVAAASAIWLILASPNVLFWALGRPAASAGQVGAGAVMFWVGVILACGGLLEWSLFMYSRDMRVTREWFGDGGAKWFYAVLGGAFALAGLGVTTWATMYSLFGTSYTSPDRPDFAAQQAAPNAVAQPLAGPQVTSSPPDKVGRLVPIERTNSPSSPSAATPQSTTPQTTAPVATTSERQPRTDFSSLPGEWRYIEGGYCIKIPASVMVTSDALDSNRGLTHQNIFTAAGKSPDDVMFNVEVWHEAKKDEPAFGTRFVHQAVLRQLPPGEPPPELIVVNGLDVMKTVTHRTQPGALRGFVTLHGVDYKFFENHCQVTLSVYSQLPVDHPDQRVLQPYLNTFQRMPKDAAAFSVTASPRGADGWQLLQGGFRVKVAPAMDIEVNAIQRSGAPFNRTIHKLYGRTANGIEFKLDLIHSDGKNEPNKARETAAASLRGRGDPDHEHVAVEVDGMVMERLTDRPRMGMGPTTVEYRYVEGPFHIIFWAHAKVPLDDPSFQAVLGSFESLERVP